MFTQIQSKHFIETIWYNPLVFHHETWTDFYWTSLQNQSTINNPEVLEERVFHNFDIKSYFPLLSYNEVTNYFYYNLLLSF